MAEGYICRRGGGGKFALPSPITAGDAIVYAKTDPITIPSAPYYIDAGAGYGFFCNIAGTYRFKFMIAGVLPHPSRYYYGRLTKNGAVISGTEKVAWGNEGRIDSFDVALAVGDVVRYQVMESDSIAKYFVVSIAIPDIRGYYPYLSIIPGIGV